MELSEILSSLTDASSMEKTASAGGQGSGSQLSSAIDRALASSSMEKTASHGGAPAGDLLKIAGDLASAEENALLKEAHLYGTAVCDGFMSRMGAYEQSGGMSKHASYGGADDYMVKQAMEQGYMDTMAQLQGAANQSNASDEHVKVAAYNEGFKDTMTKAAAYKEGFNDTMTKVSAYKEGFNDTMTKASAYNEGFNAVMGEADGLTKIAAEYEEYGFRYGNQILTSLAS